MGVKTDGKPKSSKSKKIKKNDDLSDGSDGSDDDNPEKTKAVKGNGKILFIVESKKKVEKIQPWIGNKYILMSCLGHIIDLDKHSMAINFEDDFKPSYKVNEGKEKIVKDIKSQYKKAGNIILASDPDREGEMIAWSIAKELGLKNPKRVTFIEISKNAVLTALKTPTKIDNNLVDAQKMRRLLDRIIGYTISPLLWKMIGNGQVSAGRVQSVVVKLIAEKEDKIEQFFKEENKAFFKFSGEFSDKNKKVYKSQLYTTNKQKEVLNDDSDAELEKDEKPKIVKKKKTAKEDESEDDAESEDEGDIKKGTVVKMFKTTDAKALMKNIMKSAYKITGISERDSIRKPSPPFMTSTLQQEASSKLGMNAKRTMMAAQHLYEAGHITYLRTDSLTLSKEALDDIQKYVLSKFGKDFHKKTEYKSKSKNSQEAHEAVRPTDFDKVGLSQNGGDKIGNDEVRLYNLIWKRTVASQMTPAKFKVMTIQISISKEKDYYFVTTTDRNIFPGFLRVYNIQQKEEASDSDGSDSDSDDSNNLYSRIELDEGSFNGLGISPSTTIITHSLQLAKCLLSL